MVAQVGGTLKTLQFRGTKKEKEKKKERKKREKNGVVDGSRGDCNDYRAE